MFPMITLSRFSKLNYKIVDFIRFACKFHVSGILKLHVLQQLWKFELKLQTC